MDRTNQFFFAPARLSRYPVTTSLISALRHLSPRSCGGFSHFSLRRTRASERQPVDRGCHRISRHKTSVKADLSAAFSSLRRRRGNTTRIKGALTPVFLGGCLQKQDRNPAVQIGTAAFFASTFTTLKEPNHETLTRLLDFAGVSRRGGVHVLDWNPLKRKNHYV